MKLLPFILAAAFAVVVIILTVAVANSSATQPTVTGGLHSAELMRLYEGNRRFDVNGLWCLTPLGEFNLRCMLAQHHVAQSGDAD